MGAGAGIGWLYPLVDGAPAVGWELAARYLVLPALLVGAQYASSAIISPPVNPDDDSAKTTKVPCLAWSPIKTCKVSVPCQVGLGCLVLSALLIAHCKWHENLMPALE